MIGSYICLRTPFDNRKGEGAKSIAVNLRVREWVKLQ